QRNREVVKRLLGRVPASHRKLFDFPRAHPVPKVIQNDRRRRRNAQVRLLRLIPQRNPCTLPRDIRRRRESERGLRRRVFPRQDRPILAFNAMRIGAANRQHPCAKSQQHRCHPQQNQLRPFHASHASPPELTPGFRFHALFSTPFSCSLPCSPHHFVQHPRPARRYHGCEVLTHYDGTRRMPQSSSS